MKKVERRDATPSGARRVTDVPAPPPVPREAVIQMQTTELPLEEIDYDEAYAYDAEALEARLARRSVVPESLVAVATDVRQGVVAVATDVRKSLAPEGREEAKKELRDMRRTSLRGLAALLRKAADLLDAHA
jgi:hypothetical protein